MLYDHHCKTTMACSFITLGNISFLQNNDCGYSSTRKCEIEILVMILGYKLHFYSILKETNVSRMLDEHHWKTTMAC